jgi:hypothetical protein
LSETDALERVRDPAVIADRMSDLEERIEDLHADLERYRKSSALAQVAIVGGCLAMAAAAAGVVGSGPTVFLFGIAAFLGGLVAFGATRSSMFEARANLRSLDDMRSALMDNTPMRIVEPSGEPPRSAEDPDPGAPSQPRRLH